jgi:hypothetical protein
MKTTRDERPGEDQASVDAGCSVDWSWLEGRTIETVTSDLQTWRVRFTDGQTFTVQAAEYRGQPFLAFKPYKAPVEA